MRLKIIQRKFSLLTILLLGPILIAFGQVPDSVKFSIPESKVLVSAWENLPKYIALVDSCESQIVDYKAIIKNDSIKVKACESINETKSLLITKQEEQTALLKDEKKKANRRAGIFGGIGLAELGLIIYKFIKE